MNKLYLRIILLIGFVLSLIIIILAWSITRDIVNLRYNLGESATNYMHSVFVNTITYGNYLMMSGVFLIIIFSIILVITEKRK
jgi:hypothetical protein